MPYPKMSAQKRSADIQCHFLRTLSEYSRPDEILGYIAEQVMMILEASACSIFIVDSDGKTATQRAGTGYQKNGIGKAKCQVLPEYQVESNPSRPENKLGVAGWILSTGKSFLASTPKELYAHPHRTGAYAPEISPDSPIQLQTFLGVPIRGRHGEIIGLIEAERRYDSELSSQPFSVEQQIILETIARTTGKALGYLETSYTRNVDSAITVWARDVIAEASNTESDMDGFLSIVVNVAAAAMRADSCGVYITDPSKNTLTQRAGIGSESPRFVIRSYFLPSADQIIQYPTNLHEKIGITAWIAATGKSVYAKTMRELSAHPHHLGHYDEKNFASSTECGAFLGVPLQVAGNIVGTLKVENIVTKGIPDSREFSDEAQRRFDVLAQDIALAIVRLQQHARDPYMVIIDAQATIFDMLRGGQDIQTLVSTVVRKTMQLLNARACSLYLKEGDYLVQPEWAAAGYAQAGYSPNHPIIRQYKLIGKEQLTERPTREGKVGLTVWIAVTRNKFTARSNIELRLHPHHLGVFDKFDFDQEKREQCESFMGVPLTVGDELVGVLKVESKKKIDEAGNEEYTYFSEQDELVFDLIANSVAIGIENAKLSEARRLAEQILAQTHRLLPDLHEFVKDDTHSFETLNLVANIISGRKANIASIVENYATLTLPDFPLTSLTAISELMAGLGEVLEGGRPMGMLYREFYHALQVSNTPELAQFCAQSRLSTEVQFSASHFFLSEPAANFFKIIEEVNQALQGKLETRSSLDSALAQLDASKEKVSSLAVPERGILLRIIEIWKAVLADARVRFVKITNPYIVGPPVDPQRSPFFGRQDVFNWISENLHGTTQKNILVFHGERRVGKTSILLQIESGEIGKALRTDPHHPVCPIFIDLQGFNDRGADKFLFQICDLIYKQVAEYPLIRAGKVKKPDIEQFKSLPFGAFKDYIQSTCRVLDNALLVLMVDEFERLDDLVKSEKVEQGIYDSLRSLMQFEPNLTFLLAGTHELEELSMDYRNLVHGIALIREISFMEKPDAIDLIRKPVEGLVLYEDSAVEELWHYTHGHPFLLQRLCFNLIEDMNRRGDGNFVSLGHVNNVIERFVREGNLELLLNGCTKVDQAILFALAEANHKHGRGMTQLELHAMLQAFSEPEITTSLARLVKRSLVDKSPSQKAGVAFNHTILLLAEWMVANYIH